MKITADHIGLALATTEEAPPRNLADQSFEEVQEHPILEPLAEDHEVQSPPVGDGGDHVAAEPLSCSRDDRRLPPAPVGPSCHMVGTHPHLVSPVNLGSLPLCPRPDRRALLVQPT